ncbi:hypothetical protein [Streptomyces melanosporofaciens]|uniref:Uncharacterized protein n=1 Tax=Streptomyces melanosporofaciens TaxID=67327 RepID=A0A1H4ZRL3_STRMJ|nr:hypothetical protein [Streptomyces melanosporofaciens]SED32124.1 hypothetical protein SAMN04490356_7965 [Streptomyces melanosporofaciens]
MSTALPITGTGTASQPSPAVRISRAGRTGPIAANTVLAGTTMSLFGLSWDIQWHVDVGPDTFFTLSHLMLYSGSALAGLASLAMVLIATAAQRAGQPVDQFPGGKPVRVFGGVFRAPLGYLITGTGAALFLLFGLVDLWWHSLYGFDAVLDSPPHIGLFLSISFSMVGSVIVFAAARDTRWGRAGVILSIPVLIIFSPITTKAFGALPLPVEPDLVGNILFSTLLLITGTLTIGRRATALTTAATLGVLQLLLWWFSPWAARVYADASGLPLRDNLGDNPPELPSEIPVFMLFAAAAITALLWLSRRRGWSGRIAPQIMGAGGGAVVGLSLPLQSALFGGSGPDPAELLTMTAVGLATGVLAGYLAARLAVLLREHSTASLPKGR